MPDINPLMQLGLPYDYLSLDREGQKLARLAALKDQSTPERFLRAWKLFRLMYLKPQGELWYSRGFHESPPFHDQGILDSETHLYNALEAPRGGAKSKAWVKEPILLKLLTRPFYSITLCKATDRLVQDDLAELRIQISENPHILHDFGALKPKRGSNRPWSGHMIHLLNDAKLYGFSTGARQRGSRPSMYYLDDPEFDPESDTEERRALLREQMETYLFRVVIPMLEPGCRIGWYGTFLDRKAFLYHAIMDEDPRFGRWNRRAYKACQFDEASRKITASIWPSHWTVEWLEARRAEIGDAAFEAEYCANPISERDRVLRVDPVKNGYESSVPPVNLMDLNAPRAPGPGARITYYYLKKRIKGEAPDWQIQTQDAQGLFDSMYKVVLVDFAESLKSWADYSCIAVVGFDHWNTLWVLDLWLKRVPEDILFDMIVKFGSAWNAKVIGVEGVARQAKLTEAVQMRWETLMLAGAVSDTWRPRIVPIKYPQNAATSKGDRIKGLYWRFEWGAIKLPLGLRDASGQPVWPYDQLLQQIADFTIDLKLLTHDDALDTLAMSQYVIKGRGARPREVGQTQGRASVLREITTNRGPLSGFGPLAGISPDMLTPEQVNALYARKYGPKEQDTGMLPHIWRRPTIIQRPRGSKVWV